MKQVSEKTDGTNHDVKGKEAERTSTISNNKSSEKENRKSGKSSVPTNRDLDETIRKIALMLKKGDDEGKTPDTGSAQESSRISNAIKGLSSDEKDALKEFLSGAMNNALTEKQGDGHDGETQAVRDMSTSILGVLQSVTSITGSADSGIDIASGNGALSSGGAETVSEQISRDMQFEAAGISADGGQIQSRKGVNNDISAMKHLVMEALEQIQQHVNGGVDNSQLVSSGHMDMNQVENVIRQTLSTISTREGNPSGPSSFLGAEAFRVGGGSYVQGDDDTVNALGETGQEDTVSGNQGGFAAPKGDMDSGKDFEGATRDDSSDSDSQSAGQGSDVSSLLRNDMASSSQGGFRDHLDMETRNHESVAASANTREADVEKVMGRNDNIETVASSRNLSMTVNTHDSQPVHVNMMRDTDTNGVDKNIVTLQATNEHVTQALHKSRQVLEGGFRDMGVDPASLSIEIKATDTGQSPSGEHHENGEQLAGQMQNQSSFMQNSFSGGGSNGNSGYAGSYRDGSIPVSSGVNESLSATGDIASVSNTAPAPDSPARRGLNISV